MSLFGENKLISYFVSQALHIGATLSLNLPNLPINDIIAYYAYYYIKG